MQGVLRKKPPVRKKSAKAASLEETVEDAAALALRLKAEAGLIHDEGTV